MSREKDQIINDAVELIDEGNALKLTLQELRTRAFHLNTVAHVMFDRAPPAMMWAVKKKFFNDLRIETRLNKTIQDVNGLEKQIVLLIGVPSILPKDEVVALPVTLQDLLGWSRPQLDLLVSLAKGRIKLYHTVLVQTAAYAEVLQRMVDFMLREGCM